MIEILTPPFLAQKREVSIKSNEFSLPLYLPYHQLFAMALNSPLPLQINIKEASRILLSGYQFVSKTIIELRQELLDILKEKRPIEERIKDFTERFNKSKGLDFSQYDVDPKTAKLFTPIESYAVTNKLYLDAAERNRALLIKYIEEYEIFTENISLYLESNLNPQTKVFGLLSCYF